MDIPVDEFSGAVPGDGSYDELVEEKTDGVGSSLPQA